MSTGKTYSTKYLLDSNNNRGAEGQVLISTSEGVNWINGSDITGGPYLPLSAGSGEILTGDLAMNNNIGIITKDSSGAFRDILKLNSSNVLEIGSSSLATDTIFKNSGNVGIGTTSPAYKLTVNAPNDTTAVGIDFPLAHFDFSANSTSEYTTLFNMDDTGLDIGHDSVSRSLNLKTNNLDRLTILGDGKVGIGTTSPNADLDIEGVNGVTIDINSSSGDGKLRFQDNGVIKWSVGRDNTQQNFVFSNSPGLISNNVLTLAHSTGNVGVGATSPAAKLDVAGDANISDTLAIGSSSTVPTGSSGIALNIQTLANSSGETVAELVEVDRTITTDSTSAKTWGMVVRNRSTTTSTANDGRIYGSALIGSHQGTGNITSVMGAYNQADINTTGTITVAGDLWGSYNRAFVTNGSVTFTSSGIWGTSGRAGVNGSGTVSITSQGIVGGSLIGDLDNVNATVNRVVGGEFEVNLQNGTTTKAHVVTLNTFNIVSTTNLFIDEFAYIYVGEDVTIPTTITDNAYFIKSLTSLPSELAGSIEATSFIKTGGTSSQFLKADGSIDSTSYAPSTGGSYLPLAGGTLTGALSGTSATFTNSVTADNLSGTNTGDQDLSSYALLTDITGTNSGTNTGDQDLSGYALTSAIPTDFVSKANGGTFDGAIDINGADLTVSNGNLEVGGETSITGDVTLDSAVKLSGLGGPGLLQTNASGNVSLNTTSYLKDTTDTFTGTLTVTGDVEVGGGAVTVNEGKKVIFDKDGDSFANIFHDVSDTGNMVYNSVSEHHFKNGEDDAYDVVKAGDFVRDGGTSSEFLKGNGDVDTNSYLKDTTDTFTGTLTLAGSLNLDNELDVGTTATFNDQTYFYDDLNISGGIIDSDTTITATNFILSSDERLKENVKKVRDNRVKVDWKTFELKTEKGQKRYGVIAQELEKTNPEFVRENNQGFKSVAYIDLLIAKIAELEARLEKLEK